MRVKRSPFFWLAFAALGLVWGSTWIATSTLLAYVPPLRAAAYRFLLAGLICLYQWRKLPRGRALAVSLLLAVTMVALPAVLLDWLRLQLPSATVTVLFAAMPLLLAFTAPRAAMQASIVGLGAIAFTLDASFSLVHAGAQAGAAAIGLLVVVSLAISSLLIRRELIVENPVAVGVPLLGAAGFLLLLASLVIERGQPVPYGLPWNGEGIGALIFLGAVSGAGAYATYIWLLQRMPAYQAATVQWVQPLVGFLQGALVLRLWPSLGVMAGSFVTLVCLVVVMGARSEDDDSVSLLGN